MEFCIEIVIQTRVPATMQRVINKRAKDSFEEKPTVMLKTIKRMICLSCVFFNSLQVTINFARSRVRVTSTALYILSRIQHQTRPTILCWRTIRIMLFAEDDFRQFSQNYPDLDKKLCEPPQHGKWWGRKQESRIDGFVSLSKMSFLRLNKVELSFLKL